MKGFTKVQFEKQINTLLTFINDYISFFISITNSPSVLILFICFKKYNHQNFQIKSRNKIVTNLVILVNNNLSSFINKHNFITINNSIN